MAKEINCARRRFLGAAIMTFAAAKPVLVGSADARSEAGSQAEPITRAEAKVSFGSLKQIDAGVLNVGYAEDGPADGPAVILLHGWPYDIHTYVDVAPVLASAGYRVIVPYLRGYGTTRFLSTDTAPQRPAGGARGRCHRVDGCTRDRQGNRRGLRLGRSDRQHRRRAVAGAL